MKTVRTQNNFLSYLCILAAFFVLLFFTKNIFADLQVSLDEESSAQQELQSKEAELKSLNELQKTLQENGEESLSEIQGLMWNFSDSDILEYVHSYAVDVNSTEDERLIIRSLSFSDESQTDIGFKKVEVNLSIVVSSENTLFKFLNYLSSNEEKYTFYIDNFSYPMNEVSWNLQVNVPLSLYYK